MATVTHTTMAKGPAPLRARRAPLLLPLLALLLVAGGGGALYARTRAPSPPVYSWTAASGAHALAHQIIRAPWGTLYAGTTEGVYASSDGGKTWRTLGRGFPGPGIEAWGVATVTGPGGDAVLAACQDGAVYRLPRAGSRWTRGAATIGSYATALYALPGGDALAGSDQGIFRSTDGGRSWRRTATLAGGAVAAFARDGASGALYAGLAGPSATLRVSADGGRTWRVPSRTLPPPIVEALLAVPGHVYVGVMGTQHPVWAGGGRGFSSLDRGLPPDAHGMALAITGGTSGLLFVGGMGAGVYMSAYAPASAPGALSYKPWTRLGQGPGDGVVTALLVLPGRRPVLLAGTGEGIYHLRLP